VIGSILFTSREEAHAMSEHQTPLIATIAAGLMLAFLFGLAANRLRVQPIVGYLLAGVVVGPFTPGFTADLPLAAELAEIGVILLMFGVGLHFSLKDLLSVARIAVPGAIGQIAVATAMGAGLAHLLGWPLPAGLVFGLALSVASTVVLVRALQDRHMLDTDRGRIAVGWLVVEDLPPSFRPRSRPRPHPRAPRGRAGPGGRRAPSGGRRRRRRPRRRAAPRGSARAVPGATGACRGGRGARGRTRTRGATTRVAPRAPPRARDRRSSSVGSPRPPEPQTRCRSMRVAPRR